MQWGSSPLGLEPMGGWDMESKRMTMCTRARLVEALVDAEAAPAYGKHPQTPSGSRAAHAQACRIHPNLALNWFT